MLLIYPPVARSTEPPLGIARLAGFLRSRGEEAACLDLNQEGQAFLLSREVETAGLDTWSRGALRRREASLSLLRSPRALEDESRYTRAVLDLNRALKAASPEGIFVSLTDYQDARLSPARKADLLLQAKGYASSPFFPLFSRRIEEGLASCADGRVGLSLVFLSQALSAFAIMGYLAAVHPELSVYLGGGLVSSWVAQGSLSVGEDFGGLVSALIPGRGEDGLSELLSLDSGVPSPRAARQPRPEALPDFGDFSGLGYFSPASIIPYNFSSGCPWRRCRFCPERAEASPYAACPSGAAIADIRELRTRYAPRLFHFTDNEIAPLYLRALVRDPPGAPWYGFARFTPLLADRDFCLGLAASGCVMLQLGLESADQGALDALEKGTELGQIEAALRNLREAGVSVYLYVLFGTPAEDRASALVTRDFLAAHSEEIAFLNIALFNMPLAGPDAAMQATRAFYEGELSLYCQFKHPRGWNRPEIRAFIRDELETIPDVKAIMSRTPPHFTSNHAAFFSPKYS